MTRCRLGILISGRGSNMRAIAGAVESGTLAGAEIAVVVSNRPEAAGLSYAAEKDLPTVIVERGDYDSKRDFDTAILDVLLGHQVDLALLAGYDRIIGQPLLDAYANRILNIHPSLLPKYGGRGMVGLAVHRAAIAAEDTESGCSVHLVTGDVDGGPILGQARVPVLPTDTPEQLAERVLAEEHRLYPQVIGEWVYRKFIREKEKADAHR